MFHINKKPKLRPTKLFRVIDIPQNDYDMSIERSPNRYVPYASDRYKGKTYIYVEAEKTDDYNYVRDISSSDITSSSESMKNWILMIYIPINLQNIKL
ncbi:hypothetical protein PFAG_00788 [Plasmodium falciparum Santa Lucia]|uniref:Plasmodium falciparum erythrocyte membrane protein 1 acidic terminal segment domain-containing protein n=9 Tax=Plasmodium falciparum TaxID=5833 RepID=W7JZI9_PLAFO|nr:hypothetical protein PFFVO_00831 [Plasmodium falciparum Vietnam Oak-Knoll (FVO)]ETW38316.1 hypothetical protein PFTANZ_00934 [Plasmodium falciparum Tanzania (2000708)]ETW44699.1 hypothetical protein PFNF135_00911 [Plasmodium falciparum NF135/5.C10]ETW51091.1 hypothetical protein PFMALIP_00860 [Plasmodium falciparum MaliPS096_E11]ETW63214.1 hypothetical protein PFMC_00860 [Plasmodium falciparum CAMP/Malaysia]EUR78302.1 hypothetical protein PFBG_00816 [Plasmodium falciparum 7G8]EUT91190.1 hy